MILWRHRSNQKPIKLLSRLLPYGILGRNPDNNFVSFWETRWLHKILSVFTDLYKGVHTDKNQSKLTCHLLNICFEFLGIRVSKQSKKIWWKLSEMLKLSVTSGMKTLKSAFFKEPPELTREYQLPEWSCRWNYVSWI